MEKNKENRWLLKVATTIMQQIQATTTPSVLMSWGIRDARYGVSVKDNVKRPCLVIEVSGLVYKGNVVIALNEGSDTYEILLPDEDNPEWICDVYCDQLSSLIDHLVERPTYMSDEEYEIASTVDSYIKELFDL